MKINRLVRMIASIINQIPLYFRNGTISWTAEIRGRSFLRGCSVGQYSYIAPGCNIQNAVIGNYVSIAPGVFIGGLEHPVNDLSTNTRLSNKYTRNQVTIGHDVWIAAQSSIRCGVTIGQGAVVGANSFVNKDVPPYAIVAGSPAKIIKYRFSEEIINDLIASNYYQLVPEEAMKELEQIRLKHNIK